MPKAHVVHYAAYLRKVTTSMLDYLTEYSHYPASWPTDLSNFEIVIESWVSSKYLDEFLMENDKMQKPVFKWIYREAGPLCVSPTGQMICPSTCPGSILVDFLTNHMNEAAEKSEAYNK